MTELLNTISSFRTQLSEIENTDNSKIEKIKVQLKTAMDFSNQLEKTWYGGWGQYNYDQYQNPNNQNELIEADEEYFYNLLFRTQGIDVKDIGQKLVDLLRGFRKFQKHLITELSIIKDGDGFKNEIPLLEALEKFQWGMEMSDFVKLKTPNQIPIYDYSMLSRGIDVPPHINVMGNITSLTTKAISTTNFSDLVTRLLRQLEIKSSKEVNLTDGYIDRLLFEIMDNFHSFCNQIKNRHDNRTPIKINDEYDVQDLLHAILKLHFKDVREEEYTPSYAGSSTRVDFLLKIENIVIEVKKTRPSLSDKNVGDQLILDVAHYKNHPNCKILICFVYDPESRIKNPRGLENDLKRLSNDEMTVQLLIRP